MDRWVRCRGDFPLRLPQVYFLSRFFLFLVDWHSIPVIATTMAWAANQFKATWSRTVTIVVSGELVRWGDCDGSVLVAIVVSGELVRWGDCDGSVFVA